MKNQITPRDIELLSAYLDNQLSSKDRARLEARLVQDPELKKTLQDLDRTRQLLHQLPRYRAPRNFYLKPEMVRATPRPKLAPVFGVITAVASVLLAIMLVGNQLVIPASQVALAPAQELPSQASTVQQEIARSLPPAEVPTEALPVAAMGAPAMPTDTPFTPPEPTTQLLPPTPTTIYLYAFPPTATSEAGRSIAGMPTETPTLSCEDYYGTEPLPSLPDTYYCPTATPTESEILESMLAPETLTETPTASLEPSGTASPSDTPTPTETPTPTASPTPTATPLPSSTATALPALKMVPPAASDNSGLLATPTTLVGEAVPSAATPTEVPQTSPGPSMLSYILLSAEISLAVIAVIAGFIAIILRIKAH